MTSNETKQTEQTDNLTGSLISLITNAQVRYEGTLIEINRTDRSMNLQNVRSFGTEGRRDGKNEIAAHENTIPSVVFKVDHVKDFQIIKRPEAQQIPQQNELEEQDPAIISSQQEQQEQKQQQSQSNNKQSYGAQRRQGGPPTGGQGHTHTLGGTENTSSDKPPQRELERYQRDPNAEENPNLRGESGYIHHGQGGGRGRGQYNRNYRGGNDAANGQNNRGNQKYGKINDNPNPSLQAKLKDNFDFSEPQRNLEENKNASGGNDEGERNEEFDGEDQKDEEENNNGDGFFDSFAKSGSESQQMGGRGRGGRQMRERTQQKDNDTFGEQSSASFRYQDNGRRGRGRGRGGNDRGGRGGRGRGGGDGDDFYQSNNNYRGGGQRRGGYQGYQNNGGGGYQGRGGYQNNGGGGGGYNRRGGNQGWQRSTGDPLADAKREQQRLERQEQK